MSELRVSGLHKSFGQHPVLRGIDLVVARDSLLALLGPSGSGKTTLLRVLCGFERADAGRIEIDGAPVAHDDLHVRSEQRHIGYVAQEGALFPHLSVADNIVFGLPRAQRRARHRVDELLALVGLPSAFGDRPPQALSGGQQQRVALARALAPSPSLVMLDEPFSSLDAGLRVETRQAVADALSAAHATAVLVTHDQSEALAMGHQVAVLWQGRLVQTATPETLYRQPATPQLACFVGEAVLLPGVVRNAEVVCEMGTLPLALAAPEGDATVMLRPEQIRVVGPSGGVPAVVEGRVFYGPDASVDLRLAASKQPVRVRLAGHLCPQVGETVGLLVDGAAMAYEPA
ncbi:MAG: ABC transporter ATP-binding protein [Burkholderiaceae bacterium]|jgi:iron(III) transport system ATP-binding protein|nr:MAG: ABC transporter ATP-binding protein [Burkholderiaceae bacterium]TBR75563.1 MAG: ABC transporter ATP-binding protein [Burkholderiaceae bacterium]